MGAHKLILVSSDRMDGNKKEDRNEHGLIRMSARTRDYMNFNKEYVEISAENKPPMLLKVFRAFSDDLKWVKENYSSEEQKQVGFVTTKVLEAITGDRKEKSDIWVSDDTDNVVFGVDPEFLIKSKESGNIIPAINLLHHVGELGADGAMGEVRPAPSSNPDTLVNNIKNIFQDKKYKSLITDYTLHCACYEKTGERDYPVGGHIHVGNPVDVLSVGFPDREFIYKTFNKILDELIAVPLSKLDFGDPGKNRRTNCAMSPGGGYGYFGEYRLAFNPGEDMSNSRLEHRTLSGMWLIHPTVAKATLGAAKAVIDEVWKCLKNNEFKTEYAFPEKYRQEKVWKPEFDRWNEFQLCKDLRCEMSSMEVMDLLYSSQRNTISKKFMATWLSKMKKLTTYKKYEEYINLLYEILCVSSSELQKNSRVIQENWLGNKKFI